MAGWTIVLSVAARVLPLPRALRMMTPRGRASASLPPARIARLASLVTRNCWKRAALLHRYLLLAGVDNRMVFGVRRAGEALLDGHAWIEVDGRPFPEPEPPGYHVTFVYP
jgi:hypothetical protein